MANEYLIKKDQTWHVVVNVPKALIKKGEVPRRFKASLKTSSLAEANRLKHPHVAEFLRRIENLKQHSNPKAAALRDASEWKTALDAARRDDGEDSIIFGELRDQVLALSRQLAEKDRELAQGVYKVATGQGTILRDHYATWISEVEVAEQTKVQHASTVKRFLGWAGEFATVEDTPRKRAGEYVSELLANSGLARRTVKRHLSSLSQFWQWLEAKGHAQDNVWLRHKLGKKSGVKFRKGLSDEQIVKLLSGSYATEKFRSALHDLLRLALFTGARLEELCALKRKGVHKRADGYWLEIEGGKTDAAKREVPLHGAMVPLVERRLKGAGEFLFEGLEAGGPDDKRSWYVSKAYGRYRLAVGVDGAGEDFHALRNTFIDHMEGAEVPESTVKLLVGHKRESMTYGHYSQGQRVNLRAAIERLDYSREVLKAL